MKKIIITKNNSGERIDKFLKKGIFLNDKITRGEIIKNIKAGKILVNDKIVKPSCILKDQDEISVDIKKEKNILKPSKKIKLKIIFQDKNIIAIDKPVGMQVHPVKSAGADHGACPIKHAGADHGAGPIKHAGADHGAVPIKHTGADHGAGPDDNQKENTLVNYLLAEFPEIKTVQDNTEEGKMRPGIVHRLDKDTSGVMIIARNIKTFLELKRQFKNKEIEKKYLAIVYGAPSPASGMIEKPLARSADYRKQTIAGRKTKTKIREAATYYKTLKILKNNFALLEAAPKTGRMHQIRVHLASIGHPIVGDKKYCLKNIKQLAGIGRQLLHAQSTNFSLFGKAYKFNSELPEDFKEFVEKYDNVEF